METVSPAATVWTRESATVEKRDLWTAMKRGFRCRCPRCGEGRLFSAFLKVGSNCSSCGLDYTPQSFVIKGSSARFSTIDLEVGVLLISATLPTGTRTLPSGK